MTPPPFKKRAYDESLTIVETEDLAPPLSIRTTTRTFGISPGLPPFVLEQQIESLKVELDHERNLRSLDQKRAQQTKERLEKQVQIAADEAKEATKALDDFREQSEKITEQLRQSRNQAMMELRKREIKRMEYANPAESGDDADNDFDDDEDDSGSSGKEGSSRQLRRQASSMSDVWKEKCQHLEKLLDAQRGKEKELHERCMSLRSEVEAYKAEQSESKHKSIAGSAAAGLAALEDAPPAVMKELNRVRICLADSERRERQLSRRVEDLQRRNQSLICDREEARLAQDRLPVVQEQLDQLRKEHESLAAKFQAWNEFASSLNALIHQQSPPTTEADSSWPHKQSGRNESSIVKGPPELSSVQIFLENAGRRVTELEKQNNVLYQQNKEMKTTRLSLEIQIKELAAAEETAKQEMKDFERKLNASQRQVSKLESQQAIHRREIENLQSLIKTFDDLPIPSSSGAKKDHSQQTLQFSLESTKEELQIVQQEKNRLLKESEETRNELERVKEKFGKLRDALHAERAKVEQAEQRANEAETLAGKGSFNPETTKVLHLQETPLAQSLKEEIKVLQRQLEVANKNSSSASTKIAAHDPAKLNQRLKENFKEQIALFREGVYLMTGFKVDMLPATDRPTFRVRSMYAEHEEDHLMLKWPKTEDVSSLDILNTDLAKTLSKSPSYDYMTKFHSLPAFMASAQLSWFEKQTMM